MMKTRTLQLMLVVSAFVSSLGSATEQGEALYAEHCATCHAVSLRGSAHGASLSGPAFTTKWAHQPAQALLTYQMSEMPPGQADTLSPAQHAEILQHVIAQSRLPADSLMRTSVADLSAAEAPDAVAFSGAGSVMDLARNAGEYAAKTVANFRPVSTAELNQPDDGDWLNWRRTLDGHGHSPSDSD